MRTFLITPVFLWLSYFGLFANGVDNYSFDNLSTKDGLSNNWVRTICKDQQGYIWFGTWNGLNRYDGKEFIVYKNIFSDTTSLRTNKINTITELKNGEIWIGCVGGYVCKYNRNEDNFSWILPPPDYLGRTNMNATHLLEINQFVYIGTKGSGLDVYDQQTGIIKRYLNDSNTFSIPSNTISGIAQDEMERLWIATQQGLSIFEKGNFLNYHLVSKGVEIQDILSIHIDYRNRLWIGHNKGIGLLDLNDINPVNGHFEVKNVLPELSNTIVNDIKGNGKGILYMATDKGLFIYDMENSLVKQYLPIFGEKKSISSNSIKYIYLDKPDILWLGTFNSGVNFYSRYSNLFSSITPSVNGLNNPHVSDILEDKYGKLWITTDGSGINIYNHISKEFKYIQTDAKFPNGLKNNHTIELVEDKNGDIWVALYRNGINIIDSKTLQVKKHLTASNSGLSDNEVKFMCLDKNQNVIVLTENSIQQYNYSNNQFNYHLKSLKFTKKLLLETITIDSLNNYWVGGYLGLAYHDQKTKKTIEFKHNINGPIEQNFNVLCFYIDHKGNCWVGLDEGGVKLFCKDKSTYYQFSTGNGLPHNTISNIFQDNLNNIWLTSHAGISKVIRINKDSTHIEVKTYEPESDFVFYDYNSNSCSKTKSGEIFIGGNFGIHRFKPEAIDDNPYLPPIRFKNLKIYNKKVTPKSENSPLQIVIAEQKKITLKSNQNVFSIEFIALNILIRKKTAINTI